MKWYLEVLEKDAYLKKAPTFIKDYFEEVFKNNERVLTLVRELLSVSRIDQGRVKNAPKSMDLIGAISDVVKELQPIAQKKDEKLSLEIKENRLPHMFIDPLQFHEIVENLIANAIEYTPARGEVDVTVDMRGNNVLLAIKDTGIGISSEDQKKVFTKFFRSQKAVAQNPEGSGLGLYIVKNIIARHGGKIWIESILNRGTTVYLTLPIDPSLIPSREVISSE